MWISLSMVTSTKSHFFLFKSTFPPRYLGVGWGGGFFRDCGWIHLYISLGGNPCFDDKSALEESCRSCHWPRANTGEMTQDTNLWHSDSWPPGIRRVPWGRGAGCGGTWQGRVSGTAASRSSVCPAGAGRRTCNLGDRGPHANNPQSACARTSPSAWRWPRPVRMWHWRYRTGNTPAVLQ